MVFLYSSFFINLAYLRFGYQTYKTISSPLHDLESPAGLKRRKLLLKWVCNTLILCVIVFSDYSLYFIPGYYYWRGLIFTTIIYDGRLATKIMMTFENHIDAVEKWVDKIVHAVCSIYNVAYFPAFTFLIEKLDFVVGGATPAQLELIEKLIKNFKVNIRKAQRSLAPVKKELPVKPIKKLEAKVETNNEKKLKFDKSPMTKSDKFEKPLTSPRDSTGKLTPSRHLRTSSQNLWTADVKLLKTSNLGKKTFFPYSITYDIKMKKITLKAAGDNISQSDTLIGVRIRDNSKHVLEIQLEGGNKIVSFATTELLETWAKFLETQC